MADPTLTPHLRSLILPFKNLKGLSPNNMQNAIHALGVSNLNPDEEMYLYRVLSATSACDPRMWVVLRSRLETDSYFRSHVTEIWKRMYTRMNVKSIPRLDSDYLLVSKSEYPQIASRMLNMERIS